ncbi:unnamed protein product [Clavelina lepadiformis]|uniref:Uncharacterized protein n=1 Tax=Clavelina lepadiformis TaxID=159417 RepID=A0ABP0FXG8_CLALP
MVNAVFTRVMDLLITGPSLTNAIVLDASTKGVKSASTAFWEALTMSTYNAMNTVTNTSNFSPIKYRGGIRTIRKS